MAEHLLKFKNIKHMLEKPTENKNIVRSYYDLFEYDKDDPDITEYGIMGASINHGIFEVKIDDFPQHSKRINTEAEDEKTSKDTREKIQYLIDTCSNTQEFFTEEDIITLLVEPNTEKRRERFLKRMGGIKAPTAINAVATILLLFMTRIEKDRGQIRMFLELKKDKDKLPFIAFKLYLNFWMKRLFISNSQIIRDIDLNDAYEKYIFNQYSEAEQKRAVEKVANFIAGISQFNHWEERFFYIFVLYYYQLSYLDTRKLNKQDPIVIQELLDKIADYVKEIIVNWAINYTGETAESEASK